MESPSRFSRPIGLIAALCGLASCKAFEKAPPPPVEFVFKVTTDAGQPVEGAALRIGEKELAATDAAGIGKFRLGGEEGATHDVVVRCPEGYRSPKDATGIVLRRLADPTKKAEYAALCRPDARTVVVAVRAENGANVPVVYLGKEVARTDTAGAAHVLLKLKEDEQFSLQLRTDAKEHERLKPKSPVATFAVRDRDDVVVFDQKFELERARTVYRRPARKKPTGPRRIE